MWGVTLAASSVLGVAGLAIATILFFTARLGRDINSLAKKMVAIGKEQPLAIGRPFTRELVLVAEGMQRASRSVWENTQRLQTRIAEAVQKLRDEEAERRRVEAELAHAQRLDSLGLLTGGIAHDFNNVLTVISANLELIEKHGGTERINQLAARARAGTSRGARLVSALLAFARKQPLRPELVDINELINEFHPVLKGALGDTIHLDLRLSPELDPCRIDAAQFESALLNLITNAQAAMPRGGRVTISTMSFEKSENERVAALLPLGRYARIVVTDTGLGMTPEQLAHVFEPFYTTKEVGKGTGLELAQVYGFVRQSGGDLQITSEVGTGTSLSIYLPMMSENLAEKSSRPAQLAAAGIRGTEAVMIVDDDAEVRTALAEGLRNLDYRVLEAGDGLEALRSIRAGEAIDVVVTDNLMPNGMTGRELARNIAAIDPHIRILILSGDPFADDAVETNGLIVLHKPVLLHELATAIRRQVALIVSRAAPRSDSAASKSFPPGGGLP
jgi:signal transduction histidine kinase/ActR/RegA family two-component response regulator